MTENFFTCNPLHSKGNDSYRLEVSGDTEHSQDSEEELYCLHAAASAVSPQCSAEEAANPLYSS